MSRAEAYDRGRSYLCAEAMPPRFVGGGLSESVGKPADNSPLLIFNDVATDRSSGPVGAFKSRESL